MVIFVVIGDGTGSFKTVNLEEFKPGFFNLLSYISKNLTHDVKLP